MQAINEVGVKHPYSCYMGMGGTNSGRGAILAAAETKIEGTWKAYVLVVDGVNFDDEYQQVLDQGSPLDEAVARAMFPRFSEIPYA